MMNTSAVKYIFSILVTVSGLFLFSCNRQENTGQQGAGTSVSVTPYIVKEENIEYYDIYPANVTALEEVDLRSEVSGYITAINFREGSHVEKGTKLYEIDRSKYQAVYEQASAGVAIAEANLRKAQRDAERYNKLSEQDAIAKQTLEDAHTNLNNAETQVKSAKAELTRAGTDLNYSVIKAPFSGTVGFSLVKPGTFVVGGQTLLTTISTQDPAGVDLNIDSKELPYFRELEQENHQKSDTTFRLVLEDGTLYPQPGKLSVIDRAVDPQTGTIRIRLIFPNASGRLKAGMDVRVKVLNRQSGNQLIIPFKAVTEQMGEYFVFEVHGDTVQQTRIQTGLHMGENIVVSSGIKPGDTIVSEGIQKLRNGTAVSLTRPETSGNMQ